MMKNRLENIAYFPASFFGMIMGITGLGIAYLSSAPLFTGLAEIGFGVVILASSLAGLLFLMYLYKLLRFPKEVRAELLHPIKMNFIPAISISMLLLSVAFYALNWVSSSYVLWVVGAALQLSLTFWVLYNWVHHDFFTPEHSNPAWFIPIVGNIIVPIVGVHHAPADLSWFFFAIGIVFWIVVKSILVNRIIFHAPIAERLIPTLFIFIAPPAVGFISYMALNHGELNQFAKILYFFAVTMTLLMLVSAGKFMKLQFALSWWAFTFPLAAMSIASYQMASLTGMVIYQVFAVIIHILLTLMVLWFAVKTIKAVYHQQICNDKH